uniref:RNA 2',3'-cyclic phosphodiesterase n=1 Tax=Desulforadius tongensis TaxID=1216062 RepID=UPI001EE536A7|nr:RNA 2',3'-cyclic phosphodiesterase [Desulforadius tongensis]
MRLFVAINLPAEMKVKLQQIQRRIAQCQCDVKWVKPENYHLTVKFLGDTEDNKIQKIDSVLADTAKDTAAFKLSFTGLGAFYQMGIPKVLWIGVQGDVDKLRELNQRVEEAAAGLGFPPEKRNFSPHLTLGRVKSKRKYRELIEIISALNNEDINLGTVEVESMELMQSTLKREGPVYKVINRLKFCRL